MSKNKKVQKLSEEEMQENIKKYCNGTPYVIKSALELIDGVVSEERTALIELGTLQSFDIIDVIEISKKEREFIIKYNNGERSVTITYGFKAGDQWVKTIQKSL
ncbi:hypothetical protein XaC1_243 [Xanthomonas phage XaC1]|nr:hypothetical protein XaC1_243 [Xanthomonas phage XaC1]